MSSSETAGLATTCSARTLLQVELGREAETEEQSKTERERERERDRGSENEREGENLRILMSDR